MLMMIMLLITLGVTFSNETHVAQMYVTPATDGLEVMLFLHLFAVLFEQRKHLERDRFEHVYDHRDPLQQFDFGFRSGVLLLYRVHVFRLMYLHINVYTEVRM